jgi:hypothetical protein
MNLSQTINAIEAPVKGWIARALSGGAPPGSGFLIGRYEGGHVGLLILTAASGVKSLIAQAVTHAGVPFLSYGLKQDVTNSWWARFGFANMACLELAPASRSEGDAEDPAHVKLGVPLRAVAVDATLSVHDEVCLCDATAAPIAVTLPHVVSGKYRKYTVKKVDASANAVAVISTATIDGAGSAVLASQWEYCTVVSDGSAWYKVG